MPLPTTFAGVSARGEGLFALLSGLTYKFASINNSTVSSAGQLMGRNDQTFIGTDSSGNIYVATYDGTISNSILIKYNSSYVSQWQLKFGGTVFSLYVDSSGNCYLFALSSSSVFSLQKINNSGTFQWEATVTGGTYLVPNINSSTTDSSGNVYITGNYFSYRTGNVRIGYTYYASAFVIKLNSSGVQQWSRALSYGNTSASISGSSGYGNSIAVDSSGNVYVTLRASPGSPAFWVLNSSGTTIQNLAVGTSVYTPSSTPTGSFGGITIDPTNSYVYIGWQYLSGGGTGVVRWNISSSTFDYYSVSSSYSASDLMSVICDNSGNVYLGARPGNSIPITAYNANLSSVLWQKIGLNSTTTAQSFLMDGSLAYYSSLGLLVSGYAYNSTGLSNGSATIIGNVPLNGSKSGNYTITPSIGGTDYATFQTFSSYVPVSLTLATQATGATVSSNVISGSSDSSNAWTTTTNYVTATVTI